MALKNIVLSLLAFTSIASVATAQIPAPGTPGYQEQRTAYVHRRIINQRLSLLALLQVGPQYNGYTLDSVIVNLRGSNAQVSLLVNGYIQSYAINPFGGLRLTPNFGSVLGREIGNLELEVRGFADIDSIVLNLRVDASYPPSTPPPVPNPTPAPIPPTPVPTPVPSPAPGDIAVSVPVNQNIFSGGRLDVTPYINISAYRGLRITAMEINASSLAQSAYLTTVINGQDVGSALSLNQYANTYTIYPQNAVLNQATGNVVFFANGDVSLNSVTLRLSR